jgi:hypothetical protein
MYSELYDVKFLRENLQERILKNYEIAANRAKLGYMPGECFWTRQVLASLLHKALALTVSSDEETWNALYNVYLKLSK